MPPYTNPGGINEACLTRLDIFLCPSDPAVVGEFGPNNYVANRGTTFMCDLGDAPHLRSTIAPQARADGVFYNESRVRFADIADGTSQTAMFSERLRGGGQPNPMGTNVMFIIPNQSTLQDTRRVCQSLNPGTATPMTWNMGSGWAMGEDCCTTYNHVSPPNRLHCAGVPFPANPGGTMANMAMDNGPSSPHPGGVSLLLCDGSVRYINDGIDLRTWWGLGTRHGGESLGDF